MKRIKRVANAPEAATETQRSKNHKKPTWVPRARRLALQAPVRYRPKGLGTWHEGTVENLSQSGVLLLGPQQLPDNTLVEMVFEMPEEISGQKNSTVLCQGRIIRRKDVRDAASRSAWPRPFSTTSSCANTDTACGRPRQSAPIQALDQGLNRSSPVAAMAPPAPVAVVPSTPPPPPPPKKVTIPSGTTLAVRLVDTIDSETSQQGQTFHATLDSPLAVDGEVVDSLGL